MTPSGPTRAQRRTAPDDGGDDDDGFTDDGGGRSRRGLVIGGVVAALLILGIGAAFALGVFGGGDGGEEAAPPASTNVALEPGEVTVFWPGLGGSPIAEGTPDQIMATIGQYVDDVLVPELRTGKVRPAALTPLFDDAALARVQAQGPDRDTILDEGLPEAIGKLTVESPPVALSALNDSEGATLFVSATLDLHTEARSERGRYEVKRTGELVFAPDGSGGWKITGWTLTVDRTGAGLPAGQTTDTSGPATTTTIGTP